MCCELVLIQYTMFELFTKKARRVVAMAAAHDLHVIPHGSSVYSYHLQYAFTNCPLAEYINLSPKVGLVIQNTDILLVY